MEKYINRSLEINTKTINDLFSDDFTVKSHSFSNIKSNINFTIFFIDGMVDSKTINDFILGPLINSNILSKKDNLLKTINERVLQTCETVIENKMGNAINNLLYGDCILFMEDVDHALIVSTKNFVLRSISEPEGEKVTLGPREGFNESILVNLSLLRRKLVNKNLKIISKELGVQSKTKACICYLDNIVNKKILNEVNKRIDKINIDMVLDSRYVKELISDNPNSPIDTIITTERPDIVASKLAEGRVAIIVDGSPAVITIPGLFTELFQSSDDYYLNPYFASFGRILRMIGFIISISLPALYLALLTFNMDLLPLKFVLNIAEARESLPFSTFAELIMLIVAFEVIREGGNRVPSQVGQTLTIVGALALGQAIVEAKFISIPVVIVVAFTGMTGLMTQQIKGFVIVVRFAMLILVRMSGLAGFFFGMLWVLIYISSFETFGISFTSTASHNFSQLLSDTFARLPFQKFIFRPKIIAPVNKTRQSNVQSKGEGNE